jgi:hypothetical protein
MGKWYFLQLRYQRNSVQFAANYMYVKQSILAADSSIQHSSFPDGHSLMIQE